MALSLPLIACQSYAGQSADASMDMGMQEGASDTVPNSPHDEERHDQIMALDDLPGGAGLEGTFLNTDGEEAGTVMLQETPNGLCEPEEGFTTAGGHAAPNGNSHGFRVDDGPHAGDLPNGFAHRDGHLRTDLFGSGTMLADLQDSDGFAVMVHSGADDYESQPSGDAGSRVACAAFEGGM
jgi:Cu-Zn family superoxide dismutase